MRVILVAILVTFLVLAGRCNAETDEGARVRRRQRQRQRQTETERRQLKETGSGQVALKAWAHSLTEEDYNATNWRYKFRSKSPPVFFDQYLKVMSKMFADEGAHVNFAMVGACDGLADPTIRDRFLPNKHWRTVFVEPMTPNIKDLTTYLTKNGAIDRSLIVQAAATEKCPQPFLLVERPLYEELNEQKQDGEKKNIPHWLRREIGSILPPGRTTARGPDWTLEEVRCVTASDILQDFAATPKFRKNPKQTPRTTNKHGQTIVRRRRPHVLKIDVEGHDHEVLMSFINENTPRNELPLLVTFEAKSVGKHFPAAKAEMERLGYVVSDFAADGFAMLKGTKILETLGH